MDVGIVGAGFAGTAAAIALARDGHRVTLYEKVAEPRAVGAAIVLQPSGLAALHRLGLAIPVMAKGARIDRLWVTTPRGKTVVDLDYAALDPTWHGLGVHRGTLFETLLGAAREAGAELRTGVDIADVPPAESGGRWVVRGDDGHRFGPHALVIVADGARSRLAERVGRRTSTRYPWGALWFVGPDPAAGCLRQVARGADTFLGILPTGETPDGERRRATLFWSVREDRVESWRRSFGSWRSDALALAPWARPIIETIQGPDDLFFSAYHDVNMPEWHDGDLVVLGDAAHATSPQLGQGTNLALWDALFLADVLRREPRPRRLSRALQAWAEGRRRQIVFYQRMTRWLTPFFQGDHAVLGWLRDRLMPLANRFGPTRRLMIASMSGVAAGLWGQKLSLPGPSPFV